MNSDPQDTTTDDAAHGDGAQFDALLAAAQAARAAGADERAMRLYEAALLLNPQNEPALLGLAALTADPAQARALYKRVLDANPSSEQALAALAGLDAQSDTTENADAAIVAPEPAAEDAHPQQEQPPTPLADTPTQSAETAAPQPETVAPLAAQDGVQPEAMAESADVTARPEIAPPEGFVPLSARLAQTPPSGVRSGRLGNVLMLSMLALLVFGIVSLLLLGNSPSRTHSVRAALGIYTPTATPTATATATATATPTATSTATPTPTVTPTATITPTPSPTSTPAWITAQYRPLPLDEKWIEVNLTTQTLYAWDGQELVFETLISSGRTGTATRQGKFRIQTKYVSQTMAGPGYYLPNVTWVQYFVGAMAFHTAYWHNNFGNPMSHGCVNMRAEDAEWLFSWTEPVLPAGNKSVSATASKPGTWVLVHK